MPFLNNKIDCCLLLFSLFIIFILGFPLYINYQNKNNRVAKTCNETVDENFRCPNNSFACKSCANICIERGLMCDNVQDCPDGSDEIGCQDIAGYLEHEIARLQENQQSSESDPADVLLKYKPLSCTVNQYNSENCPCNLTEPEVVICEKYGLTSIPDSLAPSVHKIRMLSNQIESIDNVTWPESLFSVALLYNRIKQIGRGAFLGAPNLAKLYLSNNEISSIDKEAFVGLNNLDKLQMESNKLTTFNTEVLFDIPNLMKLQLSENYIELPDDTRFSYGKNLQDLSLDRNKLKIVRHHWFSNMSRLELLSLAYNQISVIEEGSFDYNSKLVELNLSHNKILTLMRYTFVSRNLDPSVAAPSKIERLELADNPLHPLPADTFHDLTKLKSLDLSSVEFDHKIKSIKFPKTLDYIYFKRFSYCHYAPHVRICRPYTDGVSSSKKLLAYPTLEDALWIMATLCTLGNIFVFVWRTVSSEEDDILSLCIRNLSVADFMMGIYLGAIGWKNLKLREDETTFDWKNSWICTAFGLLAILSSELSVFILLIITVERYRSIVSNRRIESKVKKRRARYYVALAWLASALIALYPLFERLIRNKEEDIYSTSHLCLPLHIEQPFSTGWEYSAFIYLGINFSAVVVITILYTRMYLNIMRLHNQVNPVTATKHEDAILAFRFFFIVVTDCMCWIPIVVVKVMALGRMNIESWIIGWLVVFIIPINSALNPIIYTLAAPSSLRNAICRQIDRLCRTVAGASRRGYRSASSDHSSHSSSSTSGSKRISDELLQSKYGRRRKKTGSNSTTCDTIDTSTTSCSHLRSTEIISVESALIQVEINSNLLAAEEKSRTKNCFIEEDELCREMFVDREPRPSNGAMTRETSLDFDSEPPPAYECVATFEDNTYEHTIISSSNQAAPQQVLNNNQVIINRFARRVSAQRHLMVEAYSDSPERVPSSSELDRATVHGVIQQRGVGLVNYERENYNELLPSMNGTNNNGDRLGSLGFTAGKPNCDDGEMDGKLQSEQTIFTHADCQRQSVLVHRESSATISQDLSNLLMFNRSTTEPIDTRNPAAPNLDEPSGVSSKCVESTHRNLID